MVCDANRRRVLREAVATSTRLPPSQKAASPISASPLLRLSVLKLDGSSFDVQVARTARVRELKEAVEGLFTRPPKDATSSWSHVWCHFCLCYKEHRLTADKAYLRNFGIEDGDQLHFIRHLCLDHRPSKGGRPINHRTDMEQHRMPFTGSKVHDEAEENEDRDHHRVGSSEYVDGQYDLDDNYKQISHLFRGWFSYSRLSTSQRFVAKAQQNQIRQSEVTLK